MTKGENYEMEPEMLMAADIHLTLSATGQVLAIKRRVSRGLSHTLYKWTGDPPAIKIPPRREQH